MNRSIAYHIKAKWQRLLRMPRTRGFGVQSPSVYALVRYIINEKQFLKRYQIRAASYPNVSKQERLLYRLHHAFTSYEVVVKQMDGLSFLFLDELLHLAHKRTILVLQGINYTADAKAMWHSVVADKHTVVTVDLYDCGIVFFDKTKTKQHFKVNY